MVLGEPGAGKTTTLRRLAYEYAQTALEDEEAPLPIYVELGGYTREIRTPKAYVQQAFGDLGPHLTDYLTRACRPAAGRAE